MATSFLPYEPMQDFLLPPSPSEWLPEDHLAYFVIEVIDRLDLQIFYARYEGDGWRNQPFDPGDAGESVGVRVCDGSFLFAQDRQKVVRGCCVSDGWGG